MTRLRVPWSPATIMETETGLMLSLATTSVTEENVDDFKSAVKSDASLYGKYFHEMLKRGIYLAPAQFEALFISTAHTTEDLDRTI